MNMKRTATMAIVGGALLAWLAGAATSNREPPAVPVFVPAPIDIRGAELASEVARLHERLRPVASPRDPGRNLFVFHTVRPTPQVVAPAPALSEARPAVNHGESFAGEAGRRVSGGNDGDDSEGKNRIDSRISRCRMHDE